MYTISFTPDDPYSMATERRRSRIRRRRWHQTVALSVVPTPAVEDETAT